MTIRSTPRKKQSYLAILCFIFVAIIIAVIGGAMIYALTSDDTDTNGKSISYNASNVESTKDAYEEQQPGVSSNKSVASKLQPNMFGKDWVEVDGDRINGIRSVFCAPNNEVTIIYDYGGRNIPIASLPKGFLDEWNVKP